MQFLLLGVLFIIIDGSSVSVYAATAGQLSTWLSKKERADPILIRWPVWPSLRMMPASFDGR